MQQQEHDPGSEFVGKEPCPECGSQDNLARYADGHGYCFGCTTYFHPEGGEAAAKKGPSKASSRGLVEHFDYHALPTRGLTEETCRKFGYAIGVDANGKPCQVAPYFEGNTLVAQKLRYKDKQFKFIGEPKRASLFGQQLWGSGGKMVVVTEGEVDALSVSQIQGNKWPVVSIQNGAPSAKKALMAQLEWLETFETVVLMFDGDDPGRKAVEECAPLFTPGKCKVATLPLKDANEMLVAKRGPEVITAIWQAKPYRPDGIVTVGDMRERLSKPIEMGLSWPWPNLTEATYGIRTSEIYTLGAGTGMGKSETFKEVMIHLAKNHGQRIGGLFLEESPEHTIRCLAGKVGGKRFHIPDETLWTPEEFDKAVDELDQMDRVFLYDHFGHTDYDTIKSRIRFMAVSLGCRFIFLDHVTALVSGDRDNDERKQLDFIMTDLASLIRELDVGLFLISHLATADGDPHEEGGRVLLKHFRGSRAIGQWSSFVLGLEGNQQDENEARRHCRLLRVLKDRFTGQATGTTIPLSFDATTGFMRQMDKNPWDAPEEAPNPFKSDAPPEF